MVHNQRELCMKNVCRPLCLLLAPLILHVAPSINALAFSGEWNAVSSRLSTEMSFGNRCFGPEHDDTLPPPSNALFDNGFPVTRRSALSSGVAVLSTASLSAVCVAPQSARAQSIATPVSDSATDLGNGLLESRVTENLMSSPPYGLESPDVFYPGWFTGVWSVSSVLTSVEAPCGPILFGGNATLAAAKREIGKDNMLQYRARFVPVETLSGEAASVADRDFNVREIAKAAMGATAVVDVALATPNKFSCLLAPAGAGKLITVDLIALARRQEYIDGRRFHCSEVVRQIVSPASDKGRPQSQRSGSGAPLLKEVETISLYTAAEPKVAEGEINKVLCQQRSATFLLPSQDDPVAYRMWQMSRERPIDVRFYDVIYTRKS